MAKTITIRAHELNGQVQVKSIIRHPMETGLRNVKKTGKKIPPHFIKEVIVSRNNRIVMEIFWGKSVSRNPCLAFQISGNKGDSIAISWLDNRGNSDIASASVR
jgi:sulfur-oxidizing protein SoxZ